MNIYQSIRNHFGKVAHDMNSKLEPISPEIYGFLTPYAIATIHVNRGHGIKVAVLLRQSEPGEKLGVRDGKDIGLPHFVRFQNPSDWDLDPGDVSDDGMQKLAAKLAQYGRSFLIDPNADWSGFYEYFRQQREVAQGRMATALGKTKRN